MASAISCTQIEDSGEPVFEVCDLYAYESFRTHIDLDIQARNAVEALLEGKALGYACTLIDGAHPGAAAVREALIGLTLL